jgi:lysozyme
MNLSPQGRLLLTILEGSRSRAYKDAAGHWTIGIGHLIRKHEMDRLRAADLSPGEIRELLTDDLYNFEAGVISACANAGVRPTQNQFDALVLLAFNIGMGGRAKSGKVMPGLLTSTVLRRFLNRDEAGAASAFLLWNKITITDRKSGRKRKVTSRALEARRIAESRVFLHGYYDKTPYNSLDDAEKIKAMDIPSNSPVNLESVAPSESEIRPTLEASRTMKATAAGQAGSGVVTVAATVGVVKSVADQAKLAADSAGAAVKSVTEAAEATGEAATIFSNLSLWIYGSIGAGALVAVMAFVLVRRARRDDWQRGLR